MRPLSALLPVLLLTACVTTDNNASDEAFRNGRAALAEQRYEAAVSNMDAVLASHPAQLRQAQAATFRCLALAKLPNTAQAETACQTVPQQLAGQRGNELRSLQVQARWALAALREAQQPAEALAEARAIAAEFGNETNPALRHAAAIAQFVGVAILIQQNQHAEAAAWIDRIEAAGWLEPDGIYSSAMAARLAADLPNFRLALAQRQRNAAQVVAMAERYRAALLPGGDIARRDAATMLLLPLAYGRMMQADQRGLDAALEQFFAEIESIPGAPRPGFTPSALRLADPWAGYLLYDGIPKPMRERLEQAGLGRGFFDAGLNAMQRGNQQQAAEHLDRIAAALRREDHPTANELANRLLRIRRALLLQASPPPAARMQG